MELLTEDVLWFAGLCAAIACGISSILFIVILAIKNERVSRIIEKIVLVIVYCVLIFAGALGIICYISSHINCNSSGGTLIVYTDKRKIRVLFFIIENKSMEYTIYL